MNRDQSNDPLSEVLQAADETHTNARTVLSTDPSIGLGGPITLTSTVQFVGTGAGDPTTEALPLVLFEPERALIMTDPTTGATIEMQVESICRAGFTRWQRGPAMFRTAAGWTLYRTARTLQLRDNEHGLWATADHTPDPEWTSAATSQHHVVAIYGTGLGVQSPGPGGYSDADRKAAITRARTAGTAAGAIVMWERNMPEYGIGPMTEPTWRLDPQQFAAALRTQWPQVRVGFPSEPNSPAILQSLIPFDSPRRELGVDLMQSGQFVSLDPADPDTAAEFAVWFVHLLPSADTPIYLHLKENWRPLEITATTTPAEIIMHLSSSAPTRVVLYTLVGSHDWTPAAEFTCTPEDGVTLTVYDEDHGGTIARSHFNQGVPNDQQRRLVTRDEPDMFMHTLLQPSRSTYYRWADESDRTTAFEADATVHTTAPAAGALCCRCDNPIPAGAPAATVPGLAGRGLAHPDCI